MIRKFRPATPFLTPFLVSSYKNFTDIQLYSQIYPLWTYSYVIALSCFFDKTIITADHYDLTVTNAYGYDHTIPVFILADILRHKPIIVLEGLSYCASYAIVLWCNKIWHMQLMEIIFGLSTASEIAYVSYTYAVVEQKHFKRITSYVRAATLFGKFLAYGSGQLLISMDVVCYLELHKISLGTGCVTLIMACMLPSLSSRMITNKSLRKIDHLDQTYEIHSIERVSLNALPETVDHGLKAYLQDSWKHLMILKRKRTILKWCLWWSLAGCGTYQVQNYVQNLWTLLQQNDKAYNGITECAATLMGHFALMIN
uniref:Uncharacterized protein n=1 Tax=Setaria digitata TaxID=48799 RepID=A0A915Q4R5_9BILA